uniref:Uncharacterized protein n=1 Tax=Amphimedon queenslandica TaxID=400682 RepID=A0A1X7VIL6_AMPQE
MGQIVGGAKWCYHFGLFLETSKEDKVFKKYNDRGINLMISVVDLSTGEISPAKPLRSEKNWTVGEAKQYMEELWRKDWTSDSNTAQSTK